MRVLTDTNVLIRLAQQSDPDHNRADAALYALRSRGDEPCVVPQVIYEYWVVCTRPADVQGLGMTVADTTSKMRRLQQLFPLYRDERAIFERWEELVTQHDVMGKKAHDARLVAAMLRHGLTHLLTFNDSDFKRFTEITVLTPSEVAACPTHDRPPSTDEPVKALPAEPRSPKRPELRLTVRRRGRFRRVPAAVSSPVYTMGGYDDRSPKVGQMPRGGRAGL